MDQYSVARSAMIETLGTLMFENIMYRQELASQRHVNEQLQGKLKEMETQLQPTSDSPGPGTTSEVGNGSTDS